MGIALTKDNASDILIRTITPDDAPIAARLSGELGYPVLADEIRKRIEFLSGLPDQAVFVACLNDEVVGWIDLVVTHHLAYMSRAEIAGLVVADGVRSRGIGRLLVQRAEKWAAERGFEQMLVRSRSTREAAHRFYLTNGYSLSKTSAVFVKDLA